ncbi:MAG TPA: acyltransferase family protein [Spirochaetia bacterium]|nr:acyltransferase family protein [Spirochaetia bacterium]
MGTLNEQARPRLAYIDNLRWTVIIMVVLVHASVTYSGLGSWFYKEPSTLDSISTLTFAFYESFSQAFFMGILFFVAATFVPGSYDRKGFGRFVADRLVRLGVPVLIFMLVLDPFIRLMMELSAGGRPALSTVASRYASVITSGHVLERTGPLWFALALLVFSILYALARLVLSRAASTRATEHRSSRRLSTRSIHLAAIALVAIIAAGSFFVRLVQPFGTAVLNMQLCFFPQYIILFLVGLWAGRKAFLQSIPASVGWSWLKLAFAVGVPAWFLLFGAGRSPHVQGLEYFFGGWHWQAAGYAAWEAFFAVSISLGLIVLFREKANTPAPVTSFLSRTSFGVYSFHAPILVAVSLALQAVALYPLAKAGLAAAIAFAASLVVAGLVRRVPGLGHIFS